MKKISKVLIIIALLLIIVRISDPVKVTYDGSMVIETDPLFDDVSSGFIGFLI